MARERNKALLEKSIASAISAIEVYNKPDFKYREETFSILMINAWELLLKSKILNLSRLARCNRCPGPVEPLRVRGGDGRAVCRGPVLVAPGRDGAVHEVSNPICIAPMLGCRHGFDWSVWMRQSD
jgi:hypothetical protein